MLSNKSRFIMNIVAGTAALSVSLFQSVVASCFSPAFRGASRFFLDTADTKEWQALLPTGMFHGVTTNPTLLQRAGEPCTISNIHRLARLALQDTDEFMCQAWGDDLYTTGMQLSEPARDFIVVKVPVTQTGVVAASKLIRSGCRVCLTACYSSKQALVAAAIGAEYLAPYLGRMTDAGKTGEQECRNMQYIVDGMQVETRILVASIRDSAQMVELAMSGMDTFTFSPDVARELFVDPLTDKAAADFELASLESA